MATHSIKQFIRDVPDFPKAGILFRDISPLLRNPVALATSIDMLRTRWEGRTNAIAGLDARGFIFGSLLASAMQLPFVMIRKSGKLPGDVVGVAYDLEYGSAEIEVQADGFVPDARVLVVDDLLATGGTALAGCHLVEKVGAKVAGCAFVIELIPLGGRAVLGSYEVQSLVSYDDGPV